MSSRSVKKKVAILGGGISGLAAAHALARTFDVTLFEQKNQVGGWVQTEDVAGHLFELGPRTIRASGSTDLMDLIDDLGLTSQLIYSSPLAKKRYIVKNGKLRAPLAIAFSHLPALLREPFVARGGGADETIQDFITRRFSSKLAREMVDPVIQGIYGGDISKLSTKSCLSFLLNAEKEHGSILKALFLKKSGTDTRLISFKNGLGTLINALQKSLGKRIHLSEKVLSISGKQVVTEKTSYNFDTIIVALPLEGARALLPQIPAMQSVSLTAVNLAFASKIKHPPGFGFLVPSHEQKSLMGAIFDSDIFPQQGSQTRITAILRGCKYTEQEAVTATLTELKAFIQLSDTPCATHVTFAHDAIPQYPLHHDKKMAAIKLPSHIHLLGNYLHSPSLPGCISAGTTLAKKLTP